MDNIEFDIDIENFYEQINESENNTFANNLNNLFELNAEFGINKKTTTFTMSSIKTLKEMLNDIKIPYPNKEEISLIKIKDENYFINIENYIKSLVKFDDNKFNICRKCKIEKNKFFCKNCYKNICNSCYKNCFSYDHTLIDLEKYVEEIKENKKDINLIISKFFILPKEKESSTGIEKKCKNYEIIDDEIEDKPIEYTIDIILIEAIIEQNYIISLYLYIKIP